MTPESWSTAKLIPPLLGFLGAVIMLSYMRELPLTQWVPALLFGVLSAYFGPPVIVAWLLHLGWGWLPKDGSVEGVLGLALGLGGIHIVGAIAVFGKRFARDPVGVVRGRDKGGEQ